MNSVQYRPPFSSYSPSTNPLKVLGKAIGRIIEVVRNFFSWLGQKLVECYRRIGVKCYQLTHGSQAKEEKPLEPKLSPLEELMTPYKALPRGSTEFKRAAFNLAKKHLTAKEVMDIESSRDRTGYIKSIIRATVFSENAPVRLRALYPNLRTEFSQLPEADKIAILQHFNSKIKAGKIDKTPEGYHLIQNTPNKPEMVDISEQAGLWWKKCDTAVHKVGKDLAHPVLRGLVVVFDPDVIDCWGPFWEKEVDRTRTFESF